MNRKYLFSAILLVLIPSAYRLRRKQKPHDTGPGTNCLLRRTRRIL